MDRTLDLVGVSVDAPDRQRTLRATIEWSHSLLEEVERSMFARLSVFTGALTLDAVQAVGTLDGDFDALDTLSCLVAQSLVRTDDSNPEELHFGLLIIIGDFGRERLSECNEVNATNTRLACGLPTICSISSTLSARRCNAPSIAWPASEWIENSTRSDPPSIGHCEPTPPTPLRACSPRCSPTGGVGAFCR